MTAHSADRLISTPARADAVHDPVFGCVWQGWRHSMWAIDNPQLGLAHLTDGTRVVTDHGDGSLSNSARWLHRLLNERRVDLGGHSYTLHQTSFSRARLLRDGLTVGWLRRTRSSHPPSGGAVLRRRRSYRIVRWADPSDRAAIAVGHLLASRYGVGYSAASGAS